VSLEITIALMGDFSGYGQGVKTKTSVISN
jgi:hypothetical protein